MNYGWSVIKIIMKENKLSKHQLDSYNHFCNHTIQKVIGNYKVQIKKNNIVYKISFSNPVLKKPEYTEFDGKLSILYPTYCIKKKYIL